MAQRLPRLSLLTHHRQHGLRLLAFLFVGSSAVAQFDTVINLPGDPVFGDSISGSIRNGDEDPTSTAQINVAAGGTVSDFFTASPFDEVNINGGTVGREFVAGGSVVNVRGGTVGIGFRAFFGSEVNISDGFVGGLDVSQDSEVTISGGAFGRVRALAGSQVNISGGNVGNNFDALSGSQVNLSGGTLGSDFDASPGSDVELVGGEFILNGVPFTGSTITLDEVDDFTFTGTLADGSTFVFRDAADDMINGVTLTTVPLPVLDSTPRLVNTDISASPSGLRAGQTLTLQPGGVLGNSFAAVDGMLNIQGGVVGSGVEAVGSVVNIHGGTVGNDFDASHGSVVNLSGGTVGDNFDAFSGSVVNLSGGTVGKEFNALSGSEVNLFVTEVLLDGVSLEHLTVNEPFTITIPGRTSLSGRLADGSAFDFDFFPFPAFERDSLHFNATLTVTLVVPEAASATLLAAVGCAGSLGTWRSKAHRSNE